MPARLVRKAIWAFAAAIVVAILIAVLLPVVASTQIVRARIAQELSAWSGYRVSLGNAPDIEVWPSFKAVLRDVSFSTWSGSDRPPVLTAERVEANLSSLLAIGGRIVFSKVKLERPVLRVSRRGDFLYLPESPEGGRLFEAIRSLGPGSDGDTPTEALGSISFVDGRVVLVDGTAGEDILTDLGGIVEWPALDRPASLNADGIWRGEAASLALFFEAPAAFIAGDASPVTASLKADPLELSFNGSTRMAERVRVNGALTASSPSIRRTLEWSQADIAPGSAIGAASLKGNVDGNLDRLKIQDVELSLGGNPGMGALEVALAGKAPSISGTLAFDALDIGSFLSAFATSPGRAGDRGRVFDLSFTDQFTLDIRLSAASATGGRATLTDVAATAQVRSGLAAFDISDATGFGGNVQAGFRVDRKPEGDVGEMRVAATGIDWRAVAAAAGWTRNPPLAKGSVSLVMKAPVTDWRSLPRAVSGTVTGKFEAGQIAGINLPALVKRIESGGFFSLSEVADGALAIEGAEFNAVLAGGAARLSKTTAWTAQQTIALDGIIPFVGRSLALSGTIAARDAAQGNARQFFAGGSWNAPYIVSAETWPPE